MKRYLPKQKYREFIIDNININGDVSNVVTEDHIYLTEETAIRIGNSKAYTCVGKDENHYHFNVEVEPEYELLFHINMQIWSRIYQSPFVEGYIPTTMYKSPTDLPCVINLT